VIVCSIATLWYGSIAASRLIARLQSTPRGWTLKTLSTKEAGAGAGASNGAVWAAATTVNDLGGGGWLIPFVTLLFGCAPFCSVLKCPSGCPGGALWLLLLLMLLLW
jgi:hypothetical protein